MSNTDLPSVHEPSGPVGALILAAGGATRMGSSKARLRWRGKSLLRHCAEVALASQCDEVHVVVGADGAALEREVSDLDVELIHHEQWQQGIGSTIAAAVGHLGDRLDGIVILLCDQPFVTPELLDEILALHRSTRSEITACRYLSTLGPPTFFARSAFERLGSLTGDRGAKSLLTGNPEKVSTVDFPLGAFDIDTREDYDRALGELARQQGRTATT